MKVGKHDNLFAALREPVGGDRIIPYIDKWLVVSPHAGMYEVDDRPYKTRNPDRATMNFHPSSDCLKCARLLFYERDVNTPVMDQPVDAHLQAIFKMGSCCHAMIQAWFAAMSQLDGFPTLVENEMRIEGGCFEGYGVGGFIDSVIKFPGSDDPVCVEIKTISSYQFGRLGGPKPEHKLQVGCYVAWLGAPFGIVLYMNKDTCEMKEFKVEPIDLTHVLMRWSRVRAAVADGSIDTLSRECKIGSVQWERCPARDVCFSDTL